MKRHPALWEVWLGDSNDGYPVERSAITARHRADVLAKDRDNWARSKSRFHAYTATQRDAEDLYLGFASEKIREYRAKIALLMKNVTHIEARRQRRRRK